MAVKPADAKEALWHYWIRLERGGRMYLAALGDVRCKAVYVPDALVGDYKTTTNWTAYASVIKPISEWDGTVPELPTATTASAAAIDIDDIDANGEV